MREITQKIARKRLCYEDEELNDEKKIKKEMMLPDGDEDRNNTIEEDNENERRSKIALIPC